MDCRCNPINSSTRKQTMKRQTITITIETDEMTTIGQQNTLTYFRHCFKPIANAFNWSNGTMVFTDVEPSEPSIDDYLPPLN